MIVPAGRSERANCFVRNTALHDLLGHTAVPHRPPRTHGVMRPSGLTARHILERAGFLVDVVQVEERLQQMPVVEVVMPELGGDALCLGRLRHGVPEVDVRQLRPHAQVRVRYREHVRRERRPQPRVVEAEPDAVEAVSPDEELLAGTAAKLRAPVLVLLAQATLRLLDERRSLLEHGVAQGVVGDELVEAQGRVPLTVDRLDDVALNVAQNRRAVCVVAAARTVGEKPVVQLVRGDDSCLFDGLRHGLGAARNACCKSCALSVHRGPTVPRGSLGPPR